MTCLKCNKKLTMKCECKIFHTQIVCCSCVSVCHIYSWWYRCYCRFVTAVIPLIAPTTFLRSISIIAFFVYAINTLLSCQIVKLMVESATILFVTHTHTQTLLSLSFTHSLPGRIPPYHYSVCVLKYTINATRSFVYPLHLCSAHLSNLLAKIATFVNPNDEPNELSLCHCDINLLQPFNFNHRYTFFSPNVRHCTTSSELRASVVSRSKCDAFTFWHFPLIVVGIFSLL